jgi:hypothetical protein
MKQAIKSGDYYDIVELSENVNFLKATFWVCWLSEGTIYSSSSSDYSEALKLRQANLNSKIFVELSSTIQVDNKQIQVNDYRLIDKPTDKNFKIVNHIGMNVASSFWKPDFRTHLYMRFRIATVNETLFQKLSFTFHDESWYNSTTHNDYEVSNFDKPEKLEEITVPYTHPVQQLFFLIYLFEQTPTKKNSSGEPIAETMKYFFVNRNEFKFNNKSLDTIDLSNFEQLYFGK